MPNPSIYCTANCANTLCEMNRQYAEKLLRSVVLQMSNFSLVCLEYRPDPYIHGWLETEMFKRRREAEAKLWLAPIASNTSGGRELHH